jgi:hypothetical protein
VATVPDRGFDHRDSRARNELRSAALLRSDGETTTLPPMCSAVQAPREARGAFLLHRTQPVRHTGLLRMLRFLRRGRWRSVKATIRTFWNLYVGGRNLER